MEKINAETMASSGISRGVGSIESAEATGFYKVSCFGADGELKWEDEIHNLVTTVGKNFLLDNFFNTAAFTPAWYLGLVDGTSTPTPAITDTMASHAGWTENQNYSNATRPAPSWNTASAGQKATTATSFSINGAGGTIAGTFLTSNSSKGGTTGTLYSAGTFTGGNKVVANGDTLNVTYTASV